MSGLIDRKSRSNEAPIQGVRDDREVYPTSADVAEEESEEGEIRDETPVRTKRQRSLSSELGFFRDMAQPLGKVPCIISVDRKPRIGSLYPAARHGLATLFWITPGPGCAPTISVDFRTSGRWKGDTKAEFEWDAESLCKGEWAMSHFQCGHVTPNAADPRMTEQKVLALCKIEDMGNLMYVRFDSWSHAGGFCKRKAFEDQSKEVKACVQVMAQPRKSYSLEIWFLAPFNPKEFRERCLRYFTDAFRRRHRPLHSWSDPEGVRFRDTIVPPPPVKRSKNMPGKIMFRFRKAPLNRSTSPDTDGQTMLTSEAGPSSLHPEGHQTSAPGSAYEFVGSPSPVASHMEGYKPYASDDSDAEALKDSNIKSNPDADRGEDEEWPQEDEEEEDDEAA